MHAFLHGPLSWGQGLTMHTLLRGPLSWGRGLTIHFVARPLELGLGTLNPVCGVAP